MGRGKAKMAVVLSLLVLGGSASAENLAIKVLRRVRALTLKRAQPAKPKGHFFLPGSQMPLDRAEHRLIMGQLGAGEKLEVLKADSVGKGLTRPPHDQRALCAVIRNKAGEPVKRIKFEAKGELYPDQTQRQRPARLLVEKVHPAKKHILWETEYVIGTHLTKWKDGTQALVIEDLPHKPVWVNQRVFKAKDKSANFAQGVHYGDYERVDHGRLNSGKPMAIDDRSGRMIKLPSQQGEVLKRRKHLENPGILW